MSERRLPIGARFRAVLLGFALVSIAAGCGSDDNSLQFGAGSDPKTSPRGRPYPCPAKPPESGALCSTRDLSCEYSAGTCVCATDVTGMFGELAWSCPFEPEANMCPTEQPERGSACTSLVLASSECSYGRQIACHCASETQTWACWDPAKCPKQLPEDGSECDPIGQSCTYDATTCECYTTGWQCPMAD